MIGYAFMGKAHANAYRTIPYMTWPPPMMPRLVRIAGRSDQAVAEAAERYGFAEHTTDWRTLIEDPEVELLDNGGAHPPRAQPPTAPPTARPPPRSPDT